MAYPIRKPVIPPKPTEVAVEVSELISTTKFHHRLLVLVTLGFTPSDYFSYKDV
jgi:hypothetical protein